MRVGCIKTGAGEGRRGGRAKVRRGKEMSDFRLRSAETQHAAAKSRTARRGFKPIIPSKHTGPSLFPPPPSCPPSFTYLDFSRGGLNGGVKLLLKVGVDVHVSSLTGGKRTVGRKEEERREGSAGGGGRRNISFNSTRGIKGVKESKSDGERVQRQRGI